MKNKKLGGIQPSPICTIVYLISTKIICQSMNFIEEGDLYENVIAYEGISLTVQVAKIVNSKIKI